MVLTEDVLRRIAYEAGLRNNSLFVAFMKERFPQEGDKHYARKWADRFASGDPTAYMNNISLGAYINQIKKLRKVM